MKELTIIKYVCDICGKEVASEMYATQYKLKKADYTWMERHWVNLLVHDSCWRSMCDFIKNSQSKESEQNPNAE